MPGATLVTGFKVDDTFAPDGQRGGTPHFHFVYSEMYFLLSGRGAVDIIGAQGFSKVELHPHDALIFSHGTIHRLINPEGGLELLAVMGNSGPRERGAVLSFEDAIFKRDDAYTEAMTVSSFEEAYRRRDRGVAGFLEFRSRSRGGAAGAFTTANETAALQERWYDVVSSGALGEARTSLARLDAL